MIRTHNYSAALFAFLILIFLQSAQSASAVTVDYSITTDITNCSLQEFSGTNSCQIIGTVSLDSAQFGATQLVSASLDLLVNGSIYTSTFFSAIDPDPLFPCTEYCAEATTDVSGVITNLNLFGTPNYLFGHVVSVTSNSWGWDSFVAGKAFFASGSQVNIQRVNAAVPVPAGFILMITGIVGFWSLYRSKRRHQPIAAQHATA